MIPRPPIRAGRSQWTVLAFFTGAIAIVLVTFYRYLLPAIKATKGLDDADKDRLAVTSLLVLAIVLIVLVAMLLLTIRPGRFFLPRESSPRTRTKFVDAWGEAGKRIETPPADEKEEET